MKPSNIKSDLVRIMEKVEDENFLQHLYSQVEDHLKGEGDQDLGDSVRAILDERLAEHEANPENVYSREEAMRIIAKEVGE